MIRCAPYTVLAITLLGCDSAPGAQEDAFLWPAANSDLPQELEGVWHVQAVMESDCPTDWVRQMPTGHTTWSAEDGQLVIESNTGDQSSVSLWPVDEWTLYSRSGVEMLNCTATEALHMAIDDRDENQANGTSVFSLFHDGSNACQRLADAAEIPDRCETVITWQARRY